MPLLFIANLDFYIVIPFQKFIARQADPPTLHIAQDWILGILYIIAFARILRQNNFDNRFANSLQQIFRNGWENPDATMATKLCIIPMVTLLTATLILPPIGAFCCIRLHNFIKVHKFFGTNGFGFIVNKESISMVWLQKATDIIKTSNPYIISYPIFCVLMVFFFMLRVLGTLLGHWSEIIRDDIYLVGENLNNHADRLDKHGEAQE